MMIIMMKDSINSMIWRLIQQLKEAKIGVRKINIIWLVQIKMKGEERSILVIDLHPHLQDSNQMKITHKLDLNKEKRKKSLRRKNLNNIYQ